MKKKLISILLALVIILSSFAFSPSAFANSYELIPGIRQTIIINGYGDLAWLYFTPDQSGLYNLMSMNVNKSVVYLTVRDEINEETGMPEIKTLAYAGPGSDPNYEENEHNAFQFSLTYYLQKGVTYWYAVGWKPPTYTRQQFDVMFQLKTPDENPIESVELTNVPDLIAYDGGELRTDSNGKSYYHYDTSRIQSNASVTLHYKDGTSSAPTKGEVVDGFNVKWIDNQYYNHWYPDADPDHTENLIKVSVLGVEASWDVKLNIDEMTYVTGKVVNLADQPVENAEIRYDGVVKARTDSNGEFKFFVSAGAKNLTITTNSVLEYKKVIVVPVTSVGMPYTTYKICNCEFVKDGYINAKDFAYIKNNFTGSEYEKRREEFLASINFTKDKYE